VDHVAEHQRPPLGRLLAPGLIIISCTATQASAGFAHRAFGSIGPLHVTALRFAIAALTLLVIARPSLRGRSPAEWRAIATFGACIALMNWSFYQGVSRMPLGNVTSIEFTGPFLIAAFGSKSWKEARWVALAALGVLIVAHPGGTATPAGVGFAFLAALGWALYTLMSKKVGADASGLGGLALSVTVAALIVSPATIATVPTLTRADATSVTMSALLGVTFAFSLELTALRLVPAKAVSVFFSFDPVVACLIGLVMLHQPLTWSSVLGSAAIVVASVMVALHTPNETPTPLT